jgi:hypothetical protein
MVYVYTFFWIVLLLAAIANGAVREATYAQWMSELRAHQLSTFIGIALTGVIAWLFAGHFPIGSTIEALQIGGIWIVLTLAFEFIFGLCVAGKSLQTLLQDYNLFAGRVWPVFLLWILLLPYTIFHLDGRTS